jgi:hypothetical protein
LVDDFCYAGIPFKPELPRHIKIGLKPRQLFDSDLLAAPQGRDFIAFTSGLHFGGEGDSSQTQNALYALKNFIRGNHPEDSWN